MSEGSLLATRSLGLDIGGATIVADVSLEISEGELLGIIGPNGAGKTSLFNLLSGIYRPTAGSIELGGRDITGDRPYRRTRLGLGRTFQVSNVFPLLTVLENVRLSAEARLGGTMRIWRRATWVREALDRAGWALERVGLGGRQQATAGQLAHGEKRKLELAMLLAADPRVILLDEPMAGVSAEDVPELVELIRSVHRDEHKTVLIVEHHMEVVTGLAERIAVMHHGALLACDTPQAIMADETVQAAYLGQEL
ncbi:MAG: branched-chain amino acid transport system ATP-binding protein [Gaiellaceae bacterium]|nr:branched-chain amino acid transport system ATP-binding protein [Gaiellaceae bacterium]